jgi:CO/xanthine dehydrogenase FAD-binding subunit
MPAMNPRLISPEFIVDISGLDELRGIAVRRTRLRSVLRPAMSIF